MFTALTDRAYTPARVGSVVRRRGVNSLADRSCQPSYQRPLVVFHEPASDASSTEKPVIAAAR